MNERDSARKDNEWDVLVSANNDAYLLVLYERCRGNFKLDTSESGVAADPLVSETPARCSILCL